MFMMILLNIILLFSEDYNSTEEERVSYERWNVFVSAAFVIEALLKMIALGFKNYF
jgi:hypothetical protein